MRRSPLGALVLGAALLVSCSAPSTTPAPDAPVSPPSGTGAPAFPVAIEVPAIGATSELMRLGLDPDGSVAEPPETTPEIAGWYQYSPLPGRRGGAVILGHINGNGERGVFADLDDIAPGNEVFVDLDNGTRVAYRIDRVQQIPKDAFPTDAVYGPVEGAEIRLVSCGGPFDDETGHYLDNIIAWGTMV